MPAMKAPGRYLPHVVVFVTSMGVMIIELVASRIVSKYFGNSLYTWTGVIGVVLGGISLGNYLGGRLADRYEPARIVTPLLLVDSALVLLILALDALLGWVLSRGAFSGVTRGMVGTSVAAITVLFFPPAAALGAVSPVMAKLALQRSRRIGNTVGSIYAVSAVGSIAGTFLSGFLLIPALGITTVVVTVAAAIGLLAALTGGLRPVALGWLVAVAAALAYVLASPPRLPAEAAGGSLILYRADSQYSHVEVRDQRSGSKERVLILDGLIHNRYDPTRPEALLYAYERIFDALTRSFLRRERGGGPPDGPAFTTLTLGGGACLYPAYLGRHYPESRNTVVEIDPRVLEVARRYFDLPRDLPPQLELVVADARAYARTRPAGTSYDLIYLDAFSSFSVPYHLTTLEFTRRLQELLGPQGLFMANCIDVFTLGGFLGAYLRTVREVFPVTAVYVDSGYSRGSRATFVVVGTRGGGLPAELAGRSGEVVGRRLPEEELRELLERTGARALRDDRAPVENLMAPVFLHTVR